MALTKQKDTKQGFAGILLIIALLCNSIPVFSQAFTNNAMGAIFAAFPDVSATVVKMIVTVPSLMQLFFPLVSAFLERYIHRSKIILIAFVLATVGGVMPFFYGSSIYFIIGCRAVFGAGMGMFAPYAIGLIGAFFEGEKRARILGFRLAFSNILTIIFNYIGGISSNFGWRYSFLGYLILVPVAIFVLIVIPDAPPTTKVVRDESRAKPKIPWFAFIFVACNLIFRCLYTTVNTNLGIVIQANAIGTGTFTATVMSVNNAVSFLTGLTYGFIPKRVRKYGTAFGLVGLGAALFLWSGSASVAAYLAGGALVGFGFTIFGLAYTNLNLDVCDKELATTIIAISTSAAGLSQFLSPVIMDGLSSLLKYEGVTGPWRLSATVLLPWGVLAFIAIFIAYRRIEKPREATK